MRGTAIIFAKAPRAGAAKTRLGAEVGYGRAVALFRTLSRGLMAEVGRGDWRTVIAVDPAAFAKNRELWPQGMTLQGQARGDLGDRLYHAFRSAPSGPAVIIGADTAGLRTRHIKRAFLALRGADAVFGPANDGGFWLIGFKRPQHFSPTVFDGVRWSTSQAYHDVLSRLPTRMTVAEVDTLGDIDIAADLERIGPMSTAR